MTQVLEETQKESQDLLHILELESLDEQHKLKLVELLEKSRLERRTAKDILEITNPVVEFLADQKSQTFINGLKQLLGQVRKMEKRMDNRIYTMKSEKRLDLIELLGLEKEVLINDIKSGVGG